MLRFVQLAIAVAFAVVSVPRAYAVQDFKTPALPIPKMQLIVIEVPGCFYCRLFRRDVLPAYEASPRAREVPMHFLDLKAAAARQLSFSHPIDVVPTVVLFRGGEEVGRISGYPGRDNFLRSINYLVAQQR